MMIPWYMSERNELNEDSLRSAWQCLTQLGGTSPRSEALQSIPSIGLRHNETRDELRHTKHNRVPRIPSIPSITLLLPHFKRLDCNVIHATPLTHAPWSQPKDPPAAYPAATTSTHAIRTRVTSSTSPPSRHPS